MIDISIVIPVYNSSATIERAIESVLAQRDVKIEVICVDDGSTDDSVLKIYKIAKANSCVRVYKKTNSGAGSARNVGMKKALGEFIGFLDSDDYFLNPKALRAMIDRCKTARVLVCGSSMRLSQNGKISPGTNYYLMKKIALADQLDYLEYQFDYDFTCYIFQRKMLIDNGIFFPEINGYEDPPFLVQALYCARWFVVEDVDFYCYEFPAVIRHIGTAQCWGVVKGIKQNLVFAYNNNLDILFQRTLDRLEYEYGDWICLVAEENPDLLHILVDIQQYINGIFKYREYKLRTLQMVQKLKGVPYEIYLKNRINTSAEYFIYGNGKVSKAFQKYLLDSAIDTSFAGIVVTNKETDITHTSIYSLQELVAKKSMGLVLVAVSGLYAGEIVRLLEKNGIQNYEVLNLVFLSKIL